jgi:hypothetical protein
LTLNCTPLPAAVREAGCIIVLEVNQPSGPFIRDFVEGTAICGDENDPLVDLAPKHPTGVLSAESPRTVPFNLKLALEHSMATRRINPAAACCIVKQSGPSTTTLSP